MRIEVHVHGTVHLRAGVRAPDISEALQPWLEYIDVDGIDEIKSMHHDEPGLQFDTRARTLEICWSGDVGRSFGGRIEPAIRALCPLTETAAEIEVSYYDEDGNDEMNIIFIGPTTEAIHEAQRRRMAEDVSDLLARHFDEAAIGEVVALVNDLFTRDWAQRGQPGSDESMSGDSLSPAARRHLH